MWLYHRAGGGAGVQMTKARTKQKDTNEPAFSPDGRYLYFSDDATPGEIFEYSKDVNGQIYVIQRLDRQTGEIDTYVTGPGGAIRPTPSPDGKSLAFIRRVRYKSTLMLMDLASGRDTPLTDMLDRDMQETWAVHGVYPGISWTPDNRSIVFWAGGGIHRVDVASRAVSDIPFHVTGTRFVEDAVRQQKEVAPDRFDVKMVRFAQASPDGRRVVYEALGHLWIKDAAGGAPRRLTRGERIRKPIRPGRATAARSPTSPGTTTRPAGSRWSRPAAARAAIVTPEPGHYLEPAFSPDGSLIAYRKTSDGFLTTPLWGRDPGLYVVAARGGTPQARRQERHAAAVRRHQRPHLLHAPMARRTNGCSSRSISPAREEVTHLISQNAAEFALSPDEQFVAWTERYQAYVMPFARSGRSIDIAPDGKALPQSRVSTDAGDWLHWSGNGRTLYWSQGPDLFARNLGTVGRFRRRQDRRRRRSMPTSASPPPPQAARARSR